jgi:hypothetical protein
VYLKATLVDERECYGDCFDVDLRTDYRAEADIAADISIVPVNG